MIWKEVVLIRKEKSGEDELGNNIYIDKEVKTTKARFSPWTNDQTSLEDRAITLTEQKVVVPIPYGSLPKFDDIKIDNDLFKVKQKIGLSPRFSILQIKRYKDE